LQVLLQDDQDPHSLQEEAAPVKVQYDINESSILFPHFTTRNWKAGDNNWVKLREQEKTDRDAVISAIIVTPILRENSQIWWNC